MVPSRRLKSLCFTLLVLAGTVVPGALTPTIASAAQPSCSAGEILSLRTRDSSTYRTADCSYKSVFGYYLHYQASPGDWENVDLSFHQQGSNWVADHHDVTVKVAGATVEATERGTGRGIRWITPGSPSVAGRTAQYTDQGLTWTYATRISGVKLDATVDAPRGPQTYTFRYQIVGGAAPLSVDTGGNLVSDAFSVPRALIIGADGVEYPAGPWRILPGGQVAFDFDDSTLPPQAFPYDLDPTTMFNIAVSTDDGRVYGTGPSYPPPETTVDTNENIDTVNRNYNPTNTNGYGISNVLMRWNTSSLPATAHVMGAWVTVRVPAVDNNHDPTVVSTDTSNLTADSYTTWPISASAYSTVAQTTALSAESLDPYSFTPGMDDYIFLDNTSGITSTGYTGLRLHVDGSKPTGLNYLQFDSFDSTSGHGPQLTVIYDSAPTVTSASASPSAAAPGSDVTFTVGWTDPDAGDPELVAVCKTNDPGTTSAPCPGGAWAVGSLSFTTSPSSVSYTTTSSDLGTQTYYAFACDGWGLCSSTGSQGTFTVSTTAPSVTSASASPNAVSSGSGVTFSVNWVDSAPGASIQAVVCKTAEIGAGTCLGGTWASGTSSSSSPATASYATTPSDIGTQTFYAFACDASKVCSSTPAAGTFVVDNVQPTITSASVDSASVTAGDPVTFSVGWSDPDQGDAVHAVICKTNSIDAGTCPGGSWAIGLPSTISPATDSYGTTQRDAGTQTYYAFACDAANTCSSAISGTFMVNAAPDNAPTVTSASATPNPVEAGTPIQFAVQWNDPDIGDSVRAVICKTDVVNAGSCPGGAWVIGSLSEQDPSPAYYTTSLSDVGVQTYYAFACDTANACSDETTGTFSVHKVAHAPPIAPNYLGTDASYAPILHSSFVSPIGASGSVEYTVFDSTGTIVDEASGPDVASGTDSPLSIEGTADLQAGQTYAWVAHAFDGTAYSAASSAQSFTYQPVGFDSPDFSDPALTDPAVFDGTSNMSSDQDSQETPAPGDEEAPANDIPDPGGSTSDPSDATSTQTIPVTTSPTFNGFAGPTSSFLPPDSTIAAGPDNLVLAINRAVTVFSKSGTQLRTESFKQFFRINTNLNLTERWDPWVIYDRYWGGGKFIIVILANNPGSKLSYIYYAVSSSPDAMGNWSHYHINVNSLNPANPVAADFPKVGVDQDAFFITTNLYDFSGHFSRSRLYMISKQTPGYPKRFNNLKNPDGSPAVTVQPALTFNAAHEYMVDAYTTSTGAGRIALWPVVCCSTRPTPVPIRIPSFKSPPDAHQPNGISIHNLVRSALTGAAYFHGLLWTAHTVLNPAASTPEDMVRAYGINVGTHSVTEARWGDVRYDQYNPRVMVNRNGHEVLVLNYSNSTTTGPSCAYYVNAGSGFGGGSILVSTSASLLAARNKSYARSGDYSGATPAPGGVNEWVFAEYGDGTASGSTRFIQVNT
jgi:hypothetical protein